MAADAVAGQRRPGQSAVAEAQVIGRLDGVLGEVGSDPLRGQLDRAAVDGLSVGLGPEPERDRVAGWDSAGVSRTEPPLYHRRLMRFWWAYLALAAVFLLASWLYLRARGPAWELRAGWFALLGLFFIGGSFMLRRQRNQFAATRESRR